MDHQLIFQEDYLTSYHMALIRKLKELIMMK